MPSLPDGSIPALRDQAADGNSLCYPLSLSTGTVTIPDSMDVEGDIGHGRPLRLVCLDGDSGTPTPDGVTTVNTVTQ